MVEIPANSAHSPERLPTLVSSVDVADESVVAVVSSDVAVSVTTVVSVTDGRLVLAVPAAAGRDEREHRDEEHHHLPSVHLLHPLGRVSRLIPPQQSHHPLRQIPIARVSSETLSMCGVWGNMSTGVQRTSW